MKKSISIFLLFLIGFGSAVRAADGNKIINCPVLKSIKVFDHRITEDNIKAIVAAELKVLKEQEKEKDKKQEQAESKKKDGDKKAPTRAFSGTQEDKNNSVDPIKFGPTVYDAETNSLYLGAISNNAGTASIVKVEVVRKTDGTSDVNFLPLAPVKVKLNDKDLEGDTAKPETVNPIYNKKIKHLELVGPANNRVPFVVLDGGAGTDKEAYIITNTRTGTVVVSNSDEQPGGTVTKPIKDAAGQDIDKTPVAIAATEPGDLKDALLFAAVSEKDKDWKTVTTGKGEDRGIAVLIQKDGKLEPIDQGTGGAFKLDLTPDNDVKPEDITVAFFKGGTADKMDSAVIGDKVAMHWDSNLKRLYLGLSDVGRGKNAAGGGLEDAMDKDGGVISLLVGTVYKDNKISFKPVVNNPTNEFFEKKKNIIGFYRKANQNQKDKVSTLNVRTMHTSTGRDYVIVNGGIKLAAVGKKIDTLVYVLPVMPADHANAGQLAKVDNTKVKLSLPTLNTEKEFEIAAGKDDLIQNDMYSAIVGSDPELIDGTNTDRKITDMQVVGDTVYVSLNGEKSPGIFCSTALFNADGLIFSWTPWQRVAATDAVVKGFGFDSNSAGFNYLTTENEKDGDFQTLKSTAWGKTDKVLAGKLTEVLDEIFPASKGGLIKIVNFDEKTACFEAGKFSMAVAVGFDTIAIIETGKGDNFKLTDPSTYVIGTNVFVFTGDQALATKLGAGAEYSEELKNIAPLSSVEVLRNNGDKKGYLYVGGFGGVAKLQHTSGHGWTKLAELKKDGNTAAEFPGKAGNYKFDKLKFETAAFDDVDVKDVVALAASEEELHVLTFDKVFGAKDKGEDTTEQDLDGFGYDMILLKKDVARASKGILGTSKGLFVTDFTDGSKPKQVAKIGSVVSLSYLSHDKGENSKRGNLFVLEGDVFKDTGKVTRFFVDEAAADLKDVVKPIGVNGDSFKTSADLGGFRSNFVSDGTVGFNIHSRSVDNDDLLRLRMISEDTENSLTTVLDVDTKTSFIGKPVRETASGTWLVPTQDGLRING